MVLCEVLKKLLELIICKRKYPSAAECVAVAYKVLLSCFQSSSPFFDMLCFYSTLNTILHLCQLLSTEYRASVGDFVGLYHWQGMISDTDFKTKCRLQGHAKVI